MYKKILPILAIPLFFGCKSETDIVKDSNFTYVDFDNKPQIFDASFTIEEAFDNRQVCSEIIWSEFEDEQGRTIVQYECYFDNLAAYFPNWLEGRKNLELNYLKAKYDDLNEIKTKLDKVYDRQKELEPIVDNKENDFDAYSQIFGDLARLKRDQQRYLREIKQREKLFPNGFDFALEQIELKYKKSFTVESGKEIYQWVVNKDKQPINVYNGMDFNFTSSQVLTCDIDLNESLEKIYANADIDAYTTFVKTARYWVRYINSYQNYERDSFYYANVLNDYDVRHMGGVGTRLNCNVSNMN